LIHHKLNTPAPSKGKEKEEKKIEISTNLGNSLCETPECHIISVKVGKHGMVDVGNVVFHTGDSPNRTSTKEIGKKEYTDRVETMHSSLLQPQNQGTKFN